MSSLIVPNTNIVVLAGRLTKDVELRFTQSNVPVARLSLAINRSYKQGDKWEQETSFIDIIVWGERGQACSLRLSKGSAIIVEGYLKTRMYEATDGKKVKVTEVIANKVNFLEKDREDEPKNTSSKNEQSSNDYQSDVPF